MLVDLLVDHLTIAQYQVPGHILLFQPLYRGFLRSSTPQTSTACLVVASLASNHGGQLILWMVSSQVEVEMIA